MLTGELRESQDFGKLKSFIRGQFSGSLSSYSLISCFVLQPPDYFVSGPSPDLHTDPSAKMELEVKAVGRLMSSRPMSWNYLLSFDPKEPFCTCVVSPLSPQKESSNPFYPNRVFPLFVLAMTIILGYSQDTKDWLFSLLLFPFWRANRR